MSLSPVPRSEATRLPRASSVSFGIAGGITIWIIGGFGGSAAWTAIQYIQTGRAGSLFGFPTMGPVQDVFSLNLNDNPAVVNVLFAVICALAVATGVLLFIPRLAPGAAYASLVLIPIQSFFWVWMGLPLPPVVCTFTAALIVIGLVKASRPPEVSR